MAEIIHIKSPSVFNEPPPKEENLRIPEFDHNGKPVFWTMKDALEGKCDFDQIDCTKYYEKDHHVTYSMARYNDTLSKYINRKTIGEVMAERLEDAQDRWENRKFEAEVNARLDDFLRAGGSQLRDYRLNPHSKYAEVPSLMWDFRASLSSPIVVMSRGSHIAWKRCVNVRVLTPEQEWVHVPIPAEELNDHGAKLRARLLRAGANISVDTEDRKRLLHFILNAQAFDQGDAK